MDRCEVCGDGNRVYVQKFGSKWFLVKSYDYPNSHISGRFEFKTKKEAVAYGTKIGYVVFGLSNKWRRV